jgi:hypothetical protein
MELFEVLGGGKEGHVKLKQAADVVVAKRNGISLSR